MLKPFRLLEPNTVAEAAAELVGEETKIYAGGAELLLLLRHGLLDAATLVNIKRIASLNEVSWDGSNLSIGATVTHHRLETHPLVREHLPMLAQAESHIGNIRVRSQGTLGGNLCFADPHADPATALLVHEATVTVAGKETNRQLGMKEFLVGMYETALQPDELLTQVQVPPLPAGWGHAYLRIERFYRPTVNVAAAVRLSDGKLDGVRLAVGCVGPKAQRLHELEAKISGLPLEEAERVATESKPYITNELHPVDDLLGSADYKIHVTSVLLKKALGQSLRNGGGAKHG
jgi:carbon-monoxide dehydrogenase medium subunit